MRETVSPNDNLVEFLSYSLRILVDAPFPSIRRLTNGAKKISSVLGEILDS
jgi:hypothetical protein